MTCPKIQEEFLDYLERGQKKEQDYLTNKKFIKCLESILSRMAQKDGNFDSLDYSSYQWFMKCLNNDMFLDPEIDSSNNEALKKPPTLPKSYSGKTLFNKLQEWREMQGITIAELCDKLGWHYQQFYALDDDNRKVRAKLLSHVIDKLHLDMDWLLAAPNENGSTNAYVNVFKKYPPKILAWLASDEGKEAMLKEYGRYHIAKAQKELAENAAAVYEA